MTGWRNAMTLTTKIECRENYEELTAPVHCVVVTRNMGEWSTQFLAGYIGWIEDQDMVLPFDTRESAVMGKARVDKFLGIK